MSCAELNGRGRIPSSAVDRRHPGTLACGLLIAMLCAGCGPTLRPAPAPVEARPLPPAEAAPRGTATAPASPSAAGATPRPPAPYRNARDWDDYRQQAARRLVAINHATSYDGPVPEPLLAIPVLEIELNGDGSVRRIHVMRKPTQALDTVQLAIAAVQRAAPFGSVTHLPRPWKFTETFLFDEQRRFKPRTLDL
ncbi:MAG: hypothetical protein Q7U26_15245 [Aquabacterium sp.]|nr:hypothetical protein [Aquabacterium sp.]